MATYKTVIRPALEYASSIWSPLASSTSINKLQAMQNAALRTATGCTRAPTDPHLTIQTANTTSITSPPPTYNILQHSKAKHYFQHNKHSHRPPHSHYNRERYIKHAPYTHIYCLYASNHKRQ